MKRTAYFCTCTIQEHRKIWDFWNLQTPKWRPGGYRRLLVNPNLETCHSVAWIISQRTHMLCYVVETRNFHPPKTQPLLALKGQPHQLFVPVTCMWNIYSVCCSVITSTRNPIKHRDYIIKLNFISTGNNSNHSFIVYWVPDTESMDGIMQITLFVP